MRRADVPVLGAVRRAERGTGRERRVDRVDLAGVQPADRKPEPVRHRDPGVRRVALGRREGREQVAPLREAGVGAELAALPAVERARPPPEAHGLRGAALDPHDAGRPARRALPEYALLDEDDLVKSSLAQEISAPGAHGPAAHHDGVGGLRKLI